ncbi:MAG: HEPN domain-containing protein [Lachnospiraceae bacterium]|nr:HEPN domain-containing protein [Lachnospiraceae bacterium]
MLEKDLYKAANNRAYYSVFHTIDAVLALEPVAFKRHKDTLAYFNKNYVHSEKFPREIGCKIAKLEEIRHKSDYDDFYIASKEEAVKQIETAKVVMELVNTYVNEF